MSQCPQCCFLCTSRTEMATKTQSFFCMEITEKRRKIVPNLCRACFWSNNRVQGLILSNFGRSGAPLEPFWHPFGRPGPLLGRPLALLGRPWDPLGPPLGALPGAFGRSWGTCGPLQGSTDTSDPHLGRSRARFSSFCLSFPMRRASHDSSPLSAAVCAQHLELGHLDKVR